jgi:ribosomal protein S3AE
MAKARKKDDLKAKKKRWFQIVTPPVFNSMALGETTVYDPAQMIGKGLKVNLMTLTNDSKSQSVSLKFKISKIEDEIAIAEPVGYALSPSFMKRVIRRRHTRLDETYKLTSSDGRNLLIKPLLITRSIANRHAVSSLRQNCKKQLAEYAVATKFDDILLDVIDGKLQREARKGLNKIFPLKAFEVKKLEAVA